MARSPAKKGAKRKKAGKSLRRPRAKVARRVSAAAIFQTVKSIIEEGNEEEFLRHAKEKGAFAVVDPKYVDVVKDYLIKTRTARRSAAAKSVVDSDTCDEN